MLAELIRNTRSIRSFDNTKRIDAALLNNFIEDVRFTASSMNLQPLKYHIVSSFEDCDAVLPMTRWAARLKDYDGPKGKDAPAAYITVCLDTDISDNMQLFLRDVGIVAWTICMLACEKGIGACMIGSFDKEGYSDYFSLPANIKPNLVIALGYPTEQPVLEDVTDQVYYYRDEKNIHHVPKRKAEDMIIK